MTTTIASGNVRAALLADGGILWEPRFRLADGRWVAPLAKAPWADDVAATKSDDPPYIRKLGGAFLGLPFGGRAVPAEIDGWLAAEGEAPLHGHCATGLWRIAAQGDDCATLVLDFPQESSIARVEQTYICAAQAARIDCTVSIHARRTEAVAVGYHPILRLPEVAGALDIRADFALGYTGPLASGSALTKHDAAFDILGAVPAKTGPALDLGHLPIGGSAEELLLLARVAGPITARFHDAGYDLVLDWDRALLPNCLVWYHDRAADVPPWDQGFRGIGLEPCACAFDLAASTSRGPNPLTQRGEVTALMLSPSAPTVINFSLSVEAFA